MLRSIRTALNRRQEDVTLRTDTSVLVKQAIAEYIRVNYPDALSRVTVRYETEQKLVVIITPSKALAGELMMNTGDIRAHLAMHNVRVDRIVAR